MEGLPKATRLLEATESVPPVLYVEVCDIVMHISSSRSSTPLVYDNLSSTCSRSTSPTMKWFMFESGRKGKAMHELD